jgi:hypothetical protein
MSAIFSASVIPFPRTPVMRGGEAMPTEALSRFIVAALAAGEAAIVIGTPAHLAALDAQLAKRGIDVALARHEQRYFPLPAERILRDFMGDAWPDAERFERVIMTILDQARRGHRAVRAFSEMPALLRSRGDMGAAMRLERLWNKLCKDERVLLA